MCIIIVKPAKTPFPLPDRIAACFDNNPDGAGLMWREPSGKVHIFKGWMKLGQMQRWIRANQDRLKDTDVVLHFRMATHGTVAPGTCHPFPITRDVGILRKIDCVTDRAMAHNGVLTAWGDKSKTLSDTMVFVKYLSGLSDTFIANEIGQTYGKFVYMCRTDTIMFGQFVEEKDGCYYSNEGYRRYVSHWGKGDVGKYDEIYETRDYDLDACPSKFDCDRCDIIDKCPFTRWAKLAEDDSEADKVDDTTPIETEVMLADAAVLNYDLEKAKEEHDSKEILDIVPVG
jgi:hypothetical protein